MHINPRNLCPGTLIWASSVTQNSNSQDGMIGTNGHRVKDKNIQNEGQNIQEWQGM
jgi:hypothetical protein